MNEVFLGIIAAAVLVMAAVQLAAVIFAARAARRLGRLADRLEHDIQPVMASLQALTADAARATATAAAQVERIDRLFTDLAQRLDDVVAAVRRNLVAPPRGSLSWRAGLRAIAAALRELRSDAVQTPARVEEVDELFIG